MRPGKTVLLLAGVLAVGLGGCRKSPGMTGVKAARVLGPLVWTSIPADQVEVVESRRHHATRFGVSLPPPSAREGFARQVEVRFARPLDSAKVNVFASGPRHRIMLLDERRIPGEALALAMPTLALDRVEVEVRHHRRTPPLPPEVRVGREVRR